MQNTSYVMRISDWSSDVCASDLAGMATRSSDDGTKALGHWFDVFYEAVVEGVRDYYRNYSAWAPTHRLTTRRSLIRDHIVERLRTDRKSVVQGKSVSVRVDPGCRRCNNKKNISTRNAQNL